MGKFQSPLLGYNNNVRHKNRVFHIQTEDSGVNHPHIITHLFMDGGRILKSVKKSYAEHVGTDGMNETVRGLMKDQHKAMFIALRDGQFDALVDPGAKPAAPAPAPAAAPPAPPAAVAPPPAVAPASAPAPSARISTNGPVVAQVEVEVAPIAAPTSAEIAMATARTEIAMSAAVPVAPPTQPESTRDVVAVSLVPSTQPDEAPPNTIDETSRRRVGATIPPPARSFAPPRLVLADSDLEDVPVTTRQPPEARPDAAHASAAPSERELTLDFDALERAAADNASRSLFHSADLPPPPKNLFAKEAGTGGAYRAVDAEPRQSEAPRTAQPSRSSSRVPASRPPGEARYAPSRPAAIFGTTQKPPPSIFSDDLVSDKSLDEVILSYLAEDLEPPRRK